MVTIRRDREIYEAQGGWFSARWHFSFDHYRDPQQMGIGPLRVFNDDRLIPGAEWPMHPHADIESLTYVVEGTFAHADSLGNGGVLKRGAVQAMTAGRGAFHSERNGSDSEPLRFIQFWILPDQASLEPGVQQHQYSEEDRTDRLLQVFGPRGEPGLDLNQDARVYVSRLTRGHEVTHRFADGRAGYGYMISGEAVLNQDEIGAGDAAKVYGPHDLAVAAVDDSELMLVDVPASYEPVGVWAGR